MSDEVMRALEDMSALLRASGLDSLADRLENGEDIEEEAMLALEEALA